MMPLRIQTPGPIIQELPDTVPLSGVAGNGVIKKLGDRVDKQVLVSTSALALQDKPADVPAPAVASTSALAPAPALALEDEPAATAQDVLLRIMNAKSEQVAERKAQCSFLSKPWR